jgi:hypothetical protein
MGEEKWSGFRCVVVFFLACSVLSLGRIEGECECKCKERDVVVVTFRLPSPVVGTLRCHCINTALDSH